MSELQNKLMNDKYAKYNKSLWNIYIDNLNENNNKDYLIFLLKYIPYYGNSTMKDLGIF
jgi:hypothetical protein